MKNIKSYGYINNGSIPQNEYTNAKAGMSADNTIIEIDEPTSDELAYNRHLKKRQAMHPAGRRKILGWSRAWKANGWRAESAALHDELADRGRHSGYEKKNKSTF